MEIQMLFFDCFNCLIVIGKMAEYSQLHSGWGHNGWGGGGGGGSEKYGSLKILSWVMRSRVFCILPSEER